MTEDPVKPEDPETPAAPAAPAVPATPDVPETPQVPETTAEPTDLLLPPGSRLLHIGPPKTGTSSLQTAARAVRKVLAEHGVIYPGRGRNHRLETYALMGRAESVARQRGDVHLSPGQGREEVEAVPPRRLWLKLKREIDRNPDKRILISNEGIAGADRAQAQRFVDELGADRIHVVITLRPRGAILPSWWVEGLKIGLRENFRPWLKRAFALQGDPLPDTVQRYLDPGGLVERWAGVVGPQNVTVIVLDPANRDQLTDTFEAMLGLPTGLLTNVDSSEVYSNRSLTKPEAAMFRRLNLATNPRNTGSWPAYLNVISKGAVTRVLSEREPLPGESKVLLPEWAARRAVQLGRVDAQRIADSRVRVVGDLGILGQWPKIEDPADRALDRADALIPVSLAAEALAGALEGSRRLEEVTLTARLVGNPMAQLRTRTLAKELVRRIVRFAAAPIRAARR